MSNKIVNDDDHDCQQFGDKADLAERKIISCKRKHKRLAARYKFLLALSLAYNVFLTLCIVFGERF